MSLAGAGAAPGGAASNAPLWSIGEPACPAGSAPTGGAGAGTPGDTMMRAATTAGDTTSRKPAIILRASAAVRELRFASQPRIVVRLCGGTFDSVRVVERRNLPSPVVAGTTYRDVYVAVEILGHLDAACIASTLTGGGTGRAAGPCASLSFSDSAGATRGTSTPP